jgi:putative endonuclease
MTDAMSSTRRRGALGEDTAVTFLLEKGWKVLARNFRSRAGEIDIIAEKGEQVAFVEVKSWAVLPRGELEHSVDMRKQQRIVRTARYYLSRNPQLSDRHLRFDVVFLGPGAAEIRHIENAFSGEIDSWYG